MLTAITLFRTHLYSFFLTACFCYGPITLSHLVIPIQFFPFDVMLHLNNDTYPNSFMLMLNTPAGSKVQCSITPKLANLKLVCDQKEILCHANDEEINANLIHMVNIHDTPKTHSVEVSFNQIPDMQETRLHCQQVKGQDSERVNTVLPSFTNLLSSTTCHLMANEIPHHQTSMFLAFNCTHIEIFLNELAASISELEQIITSHNQEDRPDFIQLNKKCTLDMINKVFQIVNLHFDNTLFAKKNAVSYAAYELGNKIINLQCRLQYLLDLVEGTCTLRPPDDVASSPFTSDNA